MIDKSLRWMMKSIVYLLMYCNYHMPFKHYCGGSLAVMNVSVLQKHFCFSNQAYYHAVKYFSTTRCWTIICRTSNITDNRLVCRVSTSLLRWRSSLYGVRLETKRWNGDKFSLEQSIDNWLIIKSPLGPSFSEKLDFSDYAAQVPKVWMYTDTYQVH